MTIRHNTGLILVSGGTTAFSENIRASDQFDFRDNLLSRGEYGFKGIGSEEGTPTLITYYTNYTFSNNAIIGARSGRYPPGNFFPSSNALVGFVNFAGGNYRLKSTSPLHNSASDGTDIGANFTAIAAAISGTANPH